MEFVITTINAGFVRSVGGYSISEHNRFGE